VPLNHKDADDGTFLDVTVAQNKNSQAYIEVKSKDSVL
jgi:hypothetical protein